MHDHDWKAKALNEMADRLESQYAEGEWKMDPSKEYVGSQLQGIVGLEIEVGSYQAKFKLGQNRSQEDQLYMMAKLKSFGKDETSKLAAALQKIRARSNPL
jgi:transcriptional regulator